MTYKERLEEVKTSYPFKTWRGYFDDGLTQYTKDNCDRSVEIIDTLISDLAKAGLRAKPEIKIELIEKAVIEFNDLDDIRHTPKKLIYAVVNVLPKYKLHHIKVWKNKF